MEKSYKFRSADVFKFIEIYRKHECLYNPNHPNYKNRDARNSALQKFVDEFGIEGYGKKEITNKIKNLRTQYGTEKKKIRDSMKTGSRVNNIYKPKLIWYDCMDSFLSGIDTSNPIISNSELTGDCVSNDIQEDSEPETEDNFENVDINIVCEPTTSYTLEKEEIYNSPKKAFARKKRNYIEVALEKLDSIEKRARPRSESRDDIDAFGTYVASTLKTLTFTNSVHAQNEIQIILSKYKLNNVDVKQQCSTPIPESPTSKW